MLSQSVTFDEDAFTPPSVGSGNTTHTSVETETLQTSATSYTDPSLLFLSASWQLPQFHPLPRSSWTVPSPAWLREPQRWGPVEVA